MFQRFKTILLLLCRSWVAKFMYVRSNEVFLHVLSDFSQFSAIKGSPFGDFNPGADYRCAQNCTAKCLLFYSIRVFQYSCTNCLLISTVVKSNNLLQQKCHPDVTRTNDVSDRPSWTKGEVLSRRRGNLYQPRPLLPTNYHCEMLYLESLMLQWICFAARVTHPAHFARRLKRV